MEEKLLLNKNKGMFVLILTTLLYVAAIAGCVFGAISADEGGTPVILAVSIIWLFIGWIPFCGLKVLKPQEALVLTLFGKYTGTKLYTDKQSGLWFCPSHAQVAPSTGTSGKYYNSYMPIGAGTKIQGTSWYGSGSTGPYDWVFYTAKITFLRII